MPLFNPLSLGETLNLVHDAFFFGRPTRAGERKEAAAWIAARHGEPGAYANTFALLPEERRDGIRLFTGERVTSAAARHIAGEEACRALRLLDVKDAKASAALAAASAALQSCVGPLDRKPVREGARFNGYQGGTFCCGQCSVALWRHILAGGWDHAGERLARGLRYLKSCRRAGGDWRAFPFWYTMLALGEMDLPEAAAEIRHGRDRLERLAARPASGNPVTVRRVEVARRALARI